MMKKFLMTVVGGMVLAAMTFAVVGALALTARAATAAQDTVLRVDATGKVLLRGTVSAMGAGTLTVKSWGGDWTVNVLSGAQILPDLTGNDLAGFQVGDYVGAQGTVDANSAWTVDATLVRDWTYKQTMAVQQKQNRAAASQSVKSGTPRNYAGTVSGMNSDSFTLTPEGTTTAFTVEVAADAQITNRNWLFMPLAGVTDGDSVRVWGVNSNGTIAAEIVRDLTLPATSTAATR
jgi:hypothetical protein